jgi:hypothetical protein
MTMLEKIMGGYLCLLFVSVGIVYAFFTEIYLQAVKQFLDRHPAVMKLYSKIYNLPERYIVNDNSRRVRKMQGIALILFGLLCSYLQFFR